MRTLSVALALLLLACNSSPTAPRGSTGARDETIVLPFGASNQVSTNLRVKFAELVEDSRCPASVVCVWQGNGAIRLEVTTGDTKQLVTLNTAGGTGFPREATASGYTFTLVELDPQRQTTDPVPAQQYRAKIRVTRAQ